MNSTPPPDRTRGIWSRLVRIWEDPWGQMVIYLIIFAILGYGVMAVFTWVRGPERPKYVPWDAPDPRTSSTH